LNPYMKPDAADINPIGRQPSNREKEIQSAPFDAHFSARCAENRRNTFLAHFSAARGEQRTVLQIVLRVPERRIAWQAFSDHFPRGVILFESLSDRMTKITVRLRSSFKPATLAKVTRDYLTNFERVVEAQ
jgi:hypothetical protein